MKKPTKRTTKRAAKKAPRKSDFRSVSHVVGNYRDGEFCARALCYVHQEAFALVYLENWSNDEPEPVYCVIHESKFADFRRRGWELCMMYNNVHGD